MPARGFLGLLLVLVAFPISYGQADESDGRPVVTGAPPEDFCTGPPNGAVPIEYTVLLTQAQPLTRRHATPVGGETAGLLPVEDGQQIRSEAEYTRVFDKSSSGIDWSVSRIVVVRLTTRYKLGDLESGEALSGVYRDERGIYIGTDFTQYGPIQGIAQQAEWFSEAYTDLFVLLPVTPVTIEFFYCIVGGLGQTAVP